MSKKKSMGKPLVGIIWDFYGIEVKILLLKNDELSLVVIRMQKEDDRIAINTSKVFNWNRLTHFETLHFIFLMIVSLSGHL